MDHFTVIIMRLFKITNKAEKGTVRVRKKAKLGQNNQKATLTLTVNRHLKRK